MAKHDPPLRHLVSSSSTSQHALRWVVGNSVLPTGSSWTAAGAAAAGDSSISGGSGSRSGTGSEEEERGWQSIVHHRLHSSEVKRRRRWKLKEVLLPNRQRSNVAYYQGRYFSFLRGKPQILPGSDVKNLWKLFYLPPNKKFYFSSLISELPF